MPQPGLRVSWRSEGRGGSSLTMRSLRRLCLGLLVLLAGLVPGRAVCAAPTAVAIFTSPAEPIAGGPLRAMAVADLPRNAELTVHGPDGAALGGTRERRGASPFWWYIEVTASVRGVYQVCAREYGVCEDVRVDDPPGGRGRTSGEGRRPAREWNRATENLYAAWIERLFDDPLDAQPSWRALHEVTRQRHRNFLYHHRGLGEDGKRGLRLEPDCADLPYLLRAYFAWKLGLPFGYSECSRGSGGQPPTCSRWHSSGEAPASSGASLAGIQGFLQRVVDGVHSGNGRATAANDRADFYPVRLASDTLRPGTVYADPYGHTLLLVQRVPQTPTAAGMLLAVDAQPDGTVARKRYWRGNFLFALDPALGSAGFKRFRPIAHADGTPLPLASREIAASPDYGDYSLEQYETDVEGFYDRVDSVLSPEPLEPERAFRAIIDAFEEQVRARQRSVANGEDYAAAHPGVIAMPAGAAIFETTGAWEDYATPSRDLRLLIALDVVRAFPAKVEAQPRRFAMPAGRSVAQVRARLEEILRAETGSRQLSYRRSDGSEWTLTLGEVLARAALLEMAYNPNDCVEVRWGASPGSAEASACRRRAPAEQTARMARYRPWFHERRRPPR